MLKDLPNVGLETLVSKGLSFCKRVPTQPYCWIANCHSIFVYTTDTKCMEKKRYLKGKWREKNNCYGLGNSFILILYFALKLQNISQLAVPQLWKKKNIQICWIMRLLINQVSCPIHKLKLFISETWEQNYFLMFIILERLYKRKVYFLHHHFNRF